MRKISLFLAFVLVLALSAQVVPSSGNAKRIYGVPICSTLPTDTQVLTYNSTSNCWKPAAAGAGLSGGSANRFAYWTGASALTNHAFLTNGFGGSAFTPTSPVLQDGNGCGLYAAATGSGPTASRIVWDCGQTGFGTPLHFQLLNRDGASLDFQTANIGDGWLVSGLSVANSLPSGTMVMGNLVNLVSQTASIGSTGLSLKTGNDLVLYRIDSRSGAGTVTLTLGWTDQAGNAQTFVTPSITLVGQQSGTVFLYSTAATYLTTVVGTISYDLHITHYNNSFTALP